MHLSILFHQINETVCQCNQVKHAMSWMTHWSCLIEFTLVYPSLSWWPIPAFYVPILDNSSGKCFGLVTFYSSKSAANAKKQLAGRLYVENKLLNVSSNLTYLGMTHYRNDSSIYFYIPWELFRPWHSHWLFAIVNVIPLKIGVPVFSWCMYFHQKSPSRKSSHLLCMHSCPQRSCLIKSCWKLVWISKTSWWNHVWP